LAPMLTHRITDSRSGPEGPVLIWPKSNVQLTYNICLNHVVRRQLASTFGTLLSSQRTNAHPTNLLRPVRRQPFNTTPPFQALRPAGADRGPSRWSWHATGGARSASDELPGFSLRGTGLRAIFRALSVPPLRGNLENITRTGRRRQTAWSQPG
jgi:hypothetical protein